ncbi:MAG: DUF5060 domain-containing protein [Caldilineaceae bacterium]
MKPIRLYCCLMCCLVVSLLPLIACQPMQAPSNRTMNSQPSTPVTAPGAQSGVDGAAIAVLPPAKTRLAQYDRLTLVLETNIAVANPYDPAEMDILVHFTGPTGVVMTVPAFWMQPFDSRTGPTGVPGWHVRFTPTVAGEWQAQQYDPYDHLITSSNANGAFTQVWAIPEIDFSQQHDYSGGDLLATLARDFARITKTAPAKPVLMGELGYSAGAQDALDAMHLHMGLWGAPFLGYAGGSMYWWWDTFIDPQDQWYQYGALGKFFADEDLATLTPGMATVTGEAQALTLQNDQRVLLWLRSDGYRVPVAQAAYDKAVRDAIKSKTKLTTWSYAPPLLSAVTVVVNGLNDGRYHAQWYRPTTGEWLTPTELVVTNSSASLIAPDFATDLALKIEQSGE